MRGFQEHLGWSPPPKALDSLYNALAEAGSSSALRELFSHLSGDKIGFRILQTLARHGSVSNWNKQSKTQILPAAVSPPLPERLTKDTPNAN